MQTTSLEIPIGNLGALLINETHGNTGQSCEQRPKMSAAAAAGLRIWANCHWPKVILRAGKMMRKPFEVEFNYLLRLRRMQKLLG